ncbi:MAG: creatininase family protein [Planctomycetota bacterium]
MAKAKTTSGKKKVASSRRQTIPAKPTGIFADVMTSVDLAAHRKRDGIVLLPLGCFEMHCVHMGMSCDTFLVDAACRVLAGAWDAVIYPPIHYTYPGASTPWPGTVSITPRETLDYVVAVVRAIHDNGFDKVVLVSLHGPSNAMISLALREVFEVDGDMPILFSPDYGEFCRRVEAEFGAPHGEAAALLASMYMVGRHGEFDPSAKTSEKLEGPAYPFAEAGDLRRCGVTFPYYFVKPNNHVGRYPGLTVDDAPRLAEIYTEVILEKAKGVPALYDRFIKKMNDAIDKEPWEALGGDG